MQSITMSPLHRAKSLRGKLRRARRRHNRHLPEKTAPYAQKSPAVGTAREENAAGHSASRSSSDARLA